jgi:hypothetical protein
MPKTIVTVACLFLAGAASAFAQATPDASGPMGTPITPPQVGNWEFDPGISRAQAEDAASAQGFGHVSRLREDDYGNWIGESGKGALIIFPDGRAYPL